MSTQRERLIGQKIIRSFDHKCGCCGKTFVTCIPVTQYAYIHKNVWLCSYTCYMKAKQSGKKKGEDKFL